MCRFYSCLNDILRYWEIANWVVVGERIECDSNPRIGTIGNGVLRIADFWRKAENHFALALDT